MLIGDHVVLFLVTKLCCVPHRTQTQPKKKWKAENLHEHETFYLRTLHIQAAALHVQSGEARAL